MPDPRPRCACGHGAADHWRGADRCLVPSCRCERLSAPPLVDPALRALTLEHAAYADTVDAARRGER